MLYAPRGLFVTALLALTGILFVIHVVRLSARAALAYRKPARLTVSASSVRIHWRTQILGRTLRDRDVVLERAGLACLAREVRYPRAAFYAGLFFLAVGTFVGVRTLADGVRAASPTLLLTGIAFVAVGILLDFALGSLVPGAEGRCRLFIVPTKGHAICLAGVDAKRADAALGKLSPRPRDERRDPLVADPLPHHGVQLARGGAQLDAHGAGSARRRARAKPDGVIGVRAIDLVAAGPLDEARLEPRPLPLRPHRDAQALPRRDDLVPALEVRGVERDRAAPTAPSPR